MKYQMIKMGAAFNRINQQNKSDNNYKSKLYEYSRHHMTRRVCRQYEIYDKEGNFIEGNDIDEALDNFLIRKGYPPALKKSAKLGGEPIYITNTSFSNMKNNKNYADFRYWYAVEKGTKQNNKYNDEYIDQLLLEEVNKPKKVMSKETKIKRAKKNIQNGNKSKSKIINIYNSENELMFTSCGIFSTICRENNLPLNALSNSYQNKGIPLYVGSLNNINRIEEKGYMKYKGWYALIEGNERDKKYLDLKKYESEIKMKQALSKKMKKGSKGLKNGNSRNLNIVLKDSNHLVIDIYSGTVTDFYAL